MMQSGKHQVTPKVSWKNGKAEIEIEIVEKVVSERKELQGKDAWEGRECERKVLGEIWEGRECERKNLGEIWEERECERKALGEIWEEREQGRKDRGEIRKVRKEQERNVRAEREVHTQEMAEVSIYSREGEKVCAGQIAIREETVFSTILLNPHIWKGWEDPYVYEVEVNFWQEGRIMETVRTYLTVRCVAFLPIRGFLLNEKEEELKTVYCVGEVTKKEFSLLKELNANVLWLDNERAAIQKEYLGEQDQAEQDQEEKSGKEREQIEKNQREQERKKWTVQEKQKEKLSLKQILPDLQEKCDRAGILLCIDGRIEGGYCCERGEKVDLREVLCEKKVPLLYRDWGRKSLAGVAEINVLYENRGRTDLFYYYKACWSRIPFVHICNVQRENVYSHIEKTDNEQRFESAEGTITVTVYSNQKKVALYVDGYLFEYKQGPPDFKFEDISLKHCQTVFTAQAGECSISVTVERIFS